MVLPPEALIRATDHHRVAGIAHRALAECDGLDEVLVRHLRDAHDAAVRRHLRATWELGRLAPILDGSGVPWAVVKGPAMVELVYRDPGLRSYADLDVVVAPDGFDRVLESLEGVGLQPLDRNWAAIRREMFGELHFLLDGEVPLDLHWNVVNLYRGRIAIPTGEMLARTRRASLGGVDVPVLEPTDALLHLALHGALAGGDRLIWTVDVTSAMAEQPPDWAALEERALAWHIGPPVGLMLDRAERTLGADVPAGLAHRLLGRRYLVVSDMIDRRSPWQIADGRLTSASLLLSRSMGLGPGGALRWLVARSLRHFDPREPRRSAAATPAGGREDYDAFVRAVVDSGAKGQA